MYPQCLQCTSLDSPNSRMYRMQTQRPQNLPLDELLPGGGSHNLINRKSWSYTEYMSYPFPSRWYHFQSSGYMESTLPHSELITCLTPEHVIVVFLLMLQIYKGVNSENPKLCIKSTIVDFYPQLLILSTIVDFRLYFLCINNCGLFKTHNCG